MSQTLQQLPLTLSLPVVLAYFLLASSLSSGFSTSGSQGQLPSASVILEGCLDDGCLHRLSNHHSMVGKCFDPLREHLDHQLPDYSVQLCCNVAKFERCLFPFVISFCGMDSLDKFDMELRGLNSMCSMTTLQWQKCEVNKTEEIEPELKE